MAASKKPEIPQDRLDLYDKLIASMPEVERKGASVPYTSLNGHMFSYLNASGSMALKLSPSDREEFINRYKTTLFEAYGIVQKEFVKVPDDLLTRTDELRTYLEKSLRYVSSLKPKPTKKSEK